MKNTYRSALSLLSMFVIMSVAVGLENWIYNLRHSSQSEFSGTLSWLIPGNLVVLLLAGLLLAWLWFVYTQTTITRGVAIVYFVAGLGVLFYNVIGITFLTTLPMLVGRFPISLSAFVSSIVAIVGLHKLFSGKPLL